MRGELVTAPRLKNSKIPKTINDIVMKALVADVTGRYQRAADLLNDLLASRDSGSGVREGKRGAGSGIPDAGEIQVRLRAREVPQARFCWHCRKPLQARTSKCPFCGEMQR
jgi:hypothetical protein